MNGLNNSRPRLKGYLLVVVSWLGIASFAAADTPTVAPGEPLPRPRLTEALRAKIERDKSSAAASATVTMSKVVVRDVPLPNGPPKEESRKGPFSITEGGQIYQNRGKRFSTEVGLWRHIDIIDDPREALRQSERIRMSLVRISW